jgi:hypothetical protein
MGFGSAQPCRGRCRLYGQSRLVRRAGGADAATVRQLAQRLRCSQCGNRQVGIVLQPDTRPPEMREREGPRPETRGGLTD